MIERFDPLRGERLQVLDERGGVLRPDLVPPLDPDALRGLYAGMLLTRAADDKAFKLQRQGRFGTFAASRGHEASQVGAAAALEPGDWAFPYFRDLGLYVRLGYPLWLFYHYWMGNEAGNRTPDGLNIYSFAIPVGSQIPHAVGAGMAANYLRRKLAVLCTFGDGATSEGDFHEGLNFAGVFRTPTVFVCYDNQWAISVPRRRQTASPTIAQKAVAYGFPGVQVDGNDVLAVYAAAKEACDKARAGGGPTLIEAFTYRMGDHTTSDDASRYRGAEEVREWERRDPLERFRRYLESRGLWNDRDEAAAKETSTARVEDAVAKAEAGPPATLEDLFAYTFATMPPLLAEELAELRAEPRGGGR